MGVFQKYDASTLFLILKIFIANVIYYIFNMAGWLIYAFLELWFNLIFN